MYIRIIELSNHNEYFDTDKTMCFESLVKKISHLSNKKNYTTFDEKKKQGNNQN